MLYKCFAGWANMAMCLSEDNISQSMMIDDSNDDLTIEQVSDSMSNHQNYYK